MSKRIISHFNKEAAEYDNKRRSSLLRFIIKKEDQEILKLIDAKPNESILDVGCGSGYYSKIFKDLKANPFGIDISKDMIIELNKKGIPGIVSNAENFNVDKRFDKILCAGLMEFVDDPIKTFSNLKKHLKKDGLVIVLYPRKSLSGYLYYLYHISHNIKIRLYSKNQINKLINISGFHLVYKKQVDLITNIIKLK